MNKLLVLIIEDDPEDTEILTTLLSAPSWPSFGFTLLFAQDLKSGLKHLSDSPVDVVLLDLILPDSRGLETLRQLRARHPDTPVVVLTGMHDESLGMEAVMLGAQDYLLKGSMDAHALKRTVSYAVERHRLLDRMESIIAKAPDGMVVVDSSQRVQFSNLAAQGLLPAVAPGARGGSFPYPIPETGKAELKVPVGDRGERVLELRVSPIEWRDQPGRLVAIRDITDLRRIEQLKAEIIERRKVEKMKEEFINSVSHEMRTPLTILTATVASLKSGLAGPLSDKQSELVRMQHRNVLRLQRIIESVLDLARLESGKAQIHARRLNSAQLIRETAVDFRLVTAEKGIALQLELPPDLPAIHADPDLFVQVLHNLLDNALRFAKTSVRIKAGMTARRQVEISVTDDGPGIPADRVGELFNKFIQITRSGRSAGYKGTGLGLAICKEIVERQHGKIWVESVEGQGASFHFSLPQDKPTPRREARTLS